jgi:outer membrane lipoprotein-sorting protein
MYIEQKEGPRLKRRGLALRRSRDGELADRLFVVQAPENLKDLALLSQDQPDGSAAQWLYMPVYRRARRVSVQASTDAFVGSDFMYVDFGRVRVEDGAHSLTGAAEVDGRSCVVVETVTQDPSLPYRTLRSTLDRENALPLRLEYLDAEGERTRVATIDSIAVIEGWPTPISISVRTEREGSRSILKLANVDYDVGLDPNLFTVESLEGASKEP